jgi:hypothetical protein
VKPVRLAGIQNRLNLDEKEAYEEACARLKAMQEFLVVSERNTLSECVMNQKILIDLKFHLVLIKILSLPLERVARKRDEASDAQEETVEPDLVFNVPRRILFQKTCDLVCLLVKNYKRAQRLMMPHVSLLTEHIGIQASSSLTMPKSLLLLSVPFTTAHLSF